MLEAQVESYTRAAREAYAAATDPGSKAENKYDTRSLEASYLARGQALRVAETGEALAAFRLLEARGSDQEGLVSVGSLVEVISRDETVWYFLAPAGGGMELHQEGREILVLTPTSPVGRQLAGRRAGDAVNLPGGNATIGALL